MLIPNITCNVTKRLGTDVYGQEQMGTAVVTKCAIVKLLSAKMKTSVRADSSASRGNADEVVADARLLFLPQTDVAEGDEVNVAGFRLKVVGIFPRYNMPGKLDHWQVDADIWA